MRYIYFFLLLFPSAVFSQDSSRLLSNYEKFSNAAGIMYKTELMQIAIVRGLQVTLVTTTDIGTGEAASAVQISNQSVYSTTVPVDGIYIDIDEAEAVGQALKFYRAETKKENPPLPLFYNYITNNDVEVNASYDEFGGWNVSLRQCYHVFRSTIRGRYISVRNKGIDELSDAILRAKVKWAERK